MTEKNCYQEIAGVLADAVLADKPQDRLSYQEEINSVGGAVIGGSYTKMRDEAREGLSSRAVRMVRALEARGLRIHSITLYGRTGASGVALPIDDITAALVGVE